MKIAVLGLGYVGCVSAACLASRGHEVVGVDLHEAKVDLINQGRSPIVEDEIGELIASVVRDGGLRATRDVAAAVGATELSLVCVGTPSASNGSPSTEYLEAVSEQIGLAMRDLGHRHTVAYRSTMLPGTCEGLLVPLLERASGLSAGEGFGVAVNPEYLREGSSVRDFHNPPKTVIGELDEPSGDLVVSLYEGLPGETFRVPLAVAEMSKYVDNAFHGLKIGFANEIGAVCRAMGLDSHQVMDVFVADHKLNISPAYLRPGFAFGGSCLPKDLRGLVSAARGANVAVPILEHVLPSNESHLRRTVEAILATGRRRIGLFGLSFKPGTDDLRESPMVELAERLLGKGYDLRIYDPNVAVSRLIGANREFLESRHPHLAALLTGSARDVMEHAEVCVVGCADEAVLRQLDAVGDRVVVDLVRLPGIERWRASARYVAIAW
jgi:GDP-mannose 6-dehydrogenase